jgi:hypothetical protein
MKLALLRTTYNLINIQSYNVQEIELLKVTSCKNSISKQL